LCNYNYFGTAHTGRNNKKPYTTILLSSSSSMSSTIRALRLGTKHEKSMKNSCPVKPTVWGFNYDFKLSQSHNHRAVRLR